MKSFCTARRIVEAGARFVTLSWGSWDTHRSNFITLRKQLPALDIGLSALISDLLRQGVWRTPASWWVSLAAPRA